MTGMEFVKVSNPSPIIIIGAARSGTKFLRNVLAAAEGVKAVPYDINYVWRYGAEHSPDDVLDPDELTAERVKYIKNTIRRLASANNGEIVVEKTVSNSLRVPFVNEVFPDARYVHLIRDGREVTESSMRQWRAKPDVASLVKKLRSLPLSSTSYLLWFAKNFLSGLAKGRGGGGIWGPRFPGIIEATDKLSLAEVCATQWAMSVDMASNDLSAIANTDKRVFTIRYCDLVQDEVALRDLIEKLRLPNPNSILDYYRETCGVSNKDAWTRLPKKDQGVICKIVNSVGFVDSTS